MEKQSERRRRWGGAYLPLKGSDEKINTQETVWGREREGEGKRGRRRVSYRCENTE